MCNRFKYPRLDCPPACMQIALKGHNNTKQVYSVTVMTHVIAMEEGQSIIGHLSLLHRHTIILSEMIDLFTLWTVIY